MPNVESRSYGEAFIIVPAVDGSISVEPLIAAITA
jgi:hypothetical protein